MNTVLTGTLVGFGLTSDRALTNKGHRPSGTGCELSAVRLCRCRENELEEK
jgi:hypothetical protein